MDEQTRNDLEYDFGSRWGELVELALPPAYLSEALTTRLGGGFKIRLAHPLRDDAIVFLLIEDETENVVVVSFVPPTTTTLSFLGNVSGGAYSETVTYDSDGKQSVEAVYAPAFSDVAPFRIVLGPPPSAQAIERDGVKRAYERTIELVETFRSWAAQQPPGAS